MARGVTITVTHYLIARYLGLDVDFKGARNSKYLIIRSLIMLVNQIAYTSMHYVVPVPVINILNISGSIFAFIVDYLMYGTPIHKEQIMGIVVGFLGVAVTVNGELILSMIDPGYTYHSKFEHYMV
jgi:drug/metabolite transporter (DMT)-like permease